MKSRALREEQFKNFSSVKGRKKKNLQDEIIDLSMLNELEAQPVLMAQEIPLENEEIINNVGAPQDLPPELIDNSLLEDEFLASLEDQFTPPEEELIDFNSDISQTIPERVLEKIANYLKEVTEIDKTNRQPWLDIIYKAKSYLGFDIEEETNKNNDRRAKKSTDNIGASAQSKTYDTTFSTSFLRLWATLRAELLPSTGPVGFKTDVSVDETYEIKGEMIKDRLNEYLTTEDKGFYPDYDRFLFYLVLYGCVFRKIYFESDK